MRPNKLNPYVLRSNSWNSNGCSDACRSTRSSRKAMPSLNCNCTDSTPSSSLQASSHRFSQNTSQNTTTRGFSRSSSTLRPSSCIKCRTVHPGHESAPPASVQDTASKCTGALLGAACGDVLGHPVEGLVSVAIGERFPDGLSDFMPIEGWPLAGQVSGDMLLMIGLADSIVQNRKVDGIDVAKHYAEMFDPARGYREFDVRVMEALREGEDPIEAGRKYLLGGFSLTGAVRIAPVGLAYRHNTSVTVREAVREALVCTHTHPVGIEGAFLQAMAVRWLLRHDSNSEGSHPSQLLTHLMDVCEHKDIHKRLKLLRQWVKKGTWDAGRTVPWQEYLQSEQFVSGWRVSRIVADELQWSASHALCTALWALAMHWKQPEDAVMGACHFGGYTHSTACMTGALAGALHGDGWLPSRWMEQLENGDTGRDRLVGLGQELSELNIQG